MSEESCIYRTMSVGPGAMVYYAARLLSPGDRKGGIARSPSRVALCE
jgi:hypothetical protein